MKRARVRILSESPTGLNEKVSINGSICNNVQAYNKTKRGEVPGYCGVKNSDGTKYIRSNPDGSVKNNLG